MAESLAMLRDLYRTVRLIRRFEERAIELVHSGEIVGGIHPCIGQEAIAAGVCAALRADDIITSTHRGHGHVLAKGASADGMLAGRLTGLNRGRGGSTHAASFRLGVFGANGIVGAGVPIAVGAAWAARQSGADRVAVTFFGDGAVNQGFCWNRSTSHHSCGFRHLRLREQRVRLDGLRRRHDGRDDNGPGRGLRRPGIRGGRHGRGGGARIDQCGLPLASCGGTRSKTRRPRTALFCTTTGTGRGTSLA